MRKEYFTTVKNISEFTRICVEIHSTVTWWQVAFLIQILLIFGGHCSRYFSDVLLKIYKLPNFNMLFQFLLTKCSKANCCRVYRKLIT